MMDAENVRLGEICTIQYGFAFNSKKFTEDDSKIPLIRIRDVKRGFSNTYYDGPFSSEYLVHKGDLLVGMDGEFNIARWKSQDALLNQRVCKIVANSNVDEEYLRFYLKRALKDIENKTSFVTVKHLSAKKLSNLVIKLPKKNIQISISKQLSFLESLIHNFNEENVLFDELVKARFVEMFGDVIHNDRKWECKQFSDITTSRLGKMLDTKHQTGTCKYPYLANFNVQWFRFELGNLNEMDFNEKEREEFCLEDGDLLVCEGGEIGRCAVWHNQIKKCFFQKALHRVRCNQDIILPDYLSWWFKYNCENGGFTAIEGAKATISHLTGTKMKMLDVTVPPIELQEQFVDIIHQVDKSKAAVRKALDETQMLFDSLMQEYFG